jgi:hypothetical protein
LNGSALDESARRTRLGLVCLSLFVVAGCDGPAAIQRSFFADFPINRTRASLAAVELNGVLAVDADSQPEAVLKLVAEHPVEFSGELRSNDWDVVSAVNDPLNPRDLQLECVWTAFSSWGFPTNEFFGGSIGTKLNADGSFLALEETLCPPLLPQGRYMLQIVLSDRFDDLDPGPNLRYDYHVLARYKVEFNQK